MHNRLILLAALLLTSGLAQAQNHSVAARAGMLGLGAEYGYAINDRLGVRFGLNGGRVGSELDDTDIEYSFDLNWDSVSASVDFYPTARAFRVTGGILRNSNRLDLVARPTQDVTIGDQTYTPEQVGELRGRIGFQRTAPFLGVGWDRSRLNQRFGMSYDLGVLRQGSPRASLTASGELAGDPAFAGDLEAERRDVQDSVDGFELMPYVTIGFVFKF